MVSLIRPSRETVANLTRIDHTRAAINPWRGGLFAALAPRDESHAGGPGLRAVRRLRRRPTRPHLLRDARPSRAPGRSLQRLGARAGRNPANSNELRGHRPSQPVEGFADYTRLRIRAWSAQRRTTCDTRFECQELFGEKPRCHPERSEGSLRDRKDPSLRSG